MQTVIVFTFQSLGHYRNKEQSSYGMLVSSSDYVVYKLRTFEFNSHVSHYISISIPFLSSSYQIYVFKFCKFLLLSLLGYLHSLLCCASFSVVTEVLRATIYAHRLILYCFFQRFLFKMLQCNSYIAMPCSSYSSSSSSIV